MSQANAGRVLHAGCGGQSLPEWLPFTEEVRLDVDERHKPDIVASVTDMGPIGGFDTVFCSHMLEHLYPHDLQTALLEFLRVLKPGGCVIAIVPDLEDVKPTEETVYVSPGGPISGLDMIYGCRRLLKDMPFMAHHNGFISDTLRKAFEMAGFSKTSILRSSGYNLIGVAVK